MELLMELLKVQMMELVMDEREQVPGLWMDRLWKREKGLLRDEERVRG